MPNEVLPGNNVPKDNIDPSVNVPDAVKAAAAAADEAFRRAYPDQNSPQDGQLNPPTIQISDQTLEHPPAQTTQTTQIQEPVTSRSNGSQEQHTQEQHTQEQGGNQQEDWERRYRAMRGRYENIARENNQLAQRLGNLEQTLATVTQAEAQKKGVDDPTLDQISAQERAEYGEEFLSIVSKQARQTLMPTIEQLREENAKLRQQLTSVGNTVSVDSKVRLETFLDNNLTEWRDLNHNEDFLGWLAQPDAYSGQTRHTLLKQAYERNDSNRVLAFFKGFLADEAAVRPATNGATNGAGGVNLPPPKVPLEKFAAPGRARTAAPSPAEKPVITRGQISAFYAQVAAGAYAGNEAEKLRLENMIFEAQREGRIT